MSATVPTNDRPSIMRRIPAVLLGSLAGVAVFITVAAFGAPWLLGWCGFVATAVVATHLIHTGRRLRVLTSSTRVRAFAAGNGR